MELGPISNDEYHRLCDKDTRFEAFEIWDGNIWRLYLNEDQRYLGRSYVWLSSRHVDFHQLAHITPGEWEELQMIMRTFRSAVLSLWDADLINCAWLGNEYAKHRGHGHMHLVPRYHRVPTFEGREYPDERFGSDYKPYKRLKLPEQELLSIVDAVRREFLARLP